MTWQKLPAPVFQGEPVPEDRPLSRFDCPTCRRAGVLTKDEAAHRYQCRSCTRRAEGYGFETD